MKRDCTFCIFFASLFFGACRHTSPCTSQSVIERKPIAVTTRPVEGEAARFSTSAIPTDAVKYPYNHAATIAEMPNGDLLVAWGAGSREIGKDTAIVASRRPAGGREWSAPVVVADKPNFADANPALFVDDGGVVHLLHVEMFGDTFCLGRVVEQASGDSGKTWSPPRIAFDAMCVMVKNKPLIAHSGRWIVPAYNEAVYQSQFWYSNDRGKTWRFSAPPVTLLNNHLQPSVAELGDGSLLALMRNGGKGHFTWEGRSTDGGENWKLRERRDLPNPNSGLDMVRLADGHIVLAFNPSEKDRTPLAAAVSNDSGKSWSAPKTIESGPPQLSYPAVIQTRDGMIHVVYSHRLTHIQHAEFNVAWLLSAN